MPRNAARHTTYFQLMRSQCQEHRLSGVSVLSRQPQRGTYVHDPYSFLGPQEVVPDPAYSSASSSEGEDASERVSGKSKEPQLPYDYQMLSRLAETWINHPAAHTARSRPAPDVHLE
eukprot:EG_transcript_13253